MEFKNNTKHRYKTIQGLRSFKNTLPKSVQKIISKKGHIYSETLDNWRSIVGNDLFKDCFPKSFKNSNRLSPSYLSIMVKRGHEVDLEYSKKEIIHKMNGFFGDSVVEKIKLTTFDDEKEILSKNSNKSLNFNKTDKNLNVTNKKYQKKINDVKNEKIKKSLIALSKVFRKK